MKSTLEQAIERKTEELRNLQEIRKFTAALADQLEQIESKLNVMADGAESVSLILSNWRNVVGSVSLASLGLLNYAAGKKDPLPETLVRINLGEE